MTNNFVGVLEFYVTIVKIGQHKLFYDCYFNIQQVDKRIRRYSYSVQHYKWLLLNTENTQEISITSIH